MKKPAKYLVQAVKDVVNCDHVFDQARLILNHYHQTIERVEANPIFNFSATHTFFVAQLTFMTDQMLSLNHRKS